jgi:tripartite-type tricarboxylate transporter receptor subunit TctC
MRFGRAILLLGSAAIGIAGAAWGQVYPHRPIRLVVPFVPGGTIDAYARVLARQVESQIGQSIVVDNRAGANGIVGADIVAKAVPDGYTLLNNAASMVINPAMYRRMPYDTETAFVPITNFVKGLGYVMTVHPSVPANSVKELIALAKKKEGSVRFSSPGKGNGQHLAGELFNLKSGILMLHVPYKGSAPALAAALSGEVQLTFQTPTSVIPYIAAGKLRALGFTGDTRLPALPDVPTVAEAAVPGFYYDVAWHGWFAPARTPPAIVDKLYTEIRRAIQVPKVREYFRAGGFEPQADSPAQFKKIFQDDIKRYAEIVRAARIEPE